MRHILFNPQRAQYIGGLQTGTRACTAAADSQVLQHTQQVKYWPIASGCALIEESVATAVANAHSVLKAT